MGGTGVPQPHLGFLICGMGVNRSHCVLGMGGAVIRGAQGHPWASFWKPLPHWGQHFCLLCIGFVLIEGQDPQSPHLCVSQASPWHTVGAQDPARGGTGGWLGVGAEQTRGGEEAGSGCPWQEGARSFCQLSWPSFFWLGPGATGFEQGRLQGKEGGLAGQRDYLGRSSLGGLGRSSLFWQDWPGLLFAPASQEPLDVVSSQMPFLGPHTPPRPPVRLQLA